MSNNGLRKLMVIALLLMIIVGQSGLTFAGKPTNPPISTSALDITTQSMVFNLTEGDHVNFSVNATHKILMDIAWNPLISGDSQLTQTGIVETNRTVKRVVIYNEEAKYLFVPKDIDVKTTYEYMISATSKSNAKDTDQIKVTFVVTPVIVPVNNAPIAVNDSYNIEVGKTLVFNPLTNDSDPDGNALTLTSVTGVDNMTFIGSEVTFTPQVSQLGNVILNYTISDGALSATGSIMILVTPTVVNDTFVYVALGDSIPSGVSYSGTTKRIITSYTDLLAIDFDAVNTDFEYVDYSVSGHDSSELLLRLNETVVQSTIREADVITLCIGANDLMDAAIQWKIGEFAYYNFYNINWTKADAGRASFERNWPVIISKIKALNPDVKLLVSTIYNPYNNFDSMHNPVDTYMWNDESSKLGINTIIMKDSTSFNYKVVDVHKFFEENYGDNKGAVTGFYDNDPFDPHPDEVGQTVIYEQHLAAMLQ